MPSALSQTIIERMRIALPAALLVPTLLFGCVAENGSPVSVAEIQQSQPNIVFIMADDMGYGDVRVLNPESKIPTPHLDQFANEGMLFADAHTPSAVCTPTRYGVMTGRYCWRGRLKRGVINGYGKPVIEKGRATVASMLKANGYHTNIVGKWHLGLEWPAAPGAKNPAAPKRGADIDFNKSVGGVPNVNGFDHSYIIPASLDFPPYVYIKDGAVTDPNVVTQNGQRFPAFLRKGPRAKDLVMVDVLDHLADHASNVIVKQAKAEQPFFLYLPLPAPHKPVLPHPNYRGKSGLNDYGDFIMQVDGAVGRVLQAIDDAGVRDNTLVVYTSDNGSFMHRFDKPDQLDHVDDVKVQGYRPEHHRANGPLRGTKADIWEAGHRVPFFARWPGIVKPGSRTEQTVCLTDFFATCAAIVGSELDDDAAEDSFSMLSVLSGNGRNWQRAPVVHHSVSGMFAIRSGNWKLVAGNGSGGRQKPKGKAFQKPYQLFDLAADLGEENDVAKEHPDIVAELSVELERLRKSGRSR